ncbi:T9SS type A sorting domain-containing protein [Flavobacterium sp. Sd200]|uniref:zinc-dependent metalloprotease n=1 Tax=Flavobacterium sp. Sd200 TaxID=2692211 RepID=UPI0013689452|nr:zinc-dependent metalloprotease [Flavobacterium sp. Sd200]MXN91454.1 T9SS type A sorting domain-containing protein [Flavobacterium sp. Sd200]
MKKLLLSAFLLCASFLHAQIDFCGSDEVNRQYLSEHPEIAERLNEFNLRLSEDIKSGRSALQRSANNGVYEIPVVVHVIHTGGAVGTQYNPTDVQIENWIEYANNIFAAGPGFTNSEVIPVRLVLAQRDANCNATTGIVRVNGSGISGYSQNGLNRSLTTGATQDQLRALSRWTADFFYNIYIVNTIDSGSSTTGFAYYAGATPGVDGAFMKASVVNTSNNTLAHEIGHAMGLKHVFDGASSSGGQCPVNADCTLDNDMVCDTAPVQSLLSTYPYPTNNSFNVCSQANYNGEQHNIMNYGAIRDRFTLGQSERAVAQVLQFRQSLLSSKGGMAPDANQAIEVVSGCTPYNAGVIAANYAIGPRQVTFGTINNFTSGRLADASDYYVDYSQLSCLSRSVSTSVLYNTGTDLTVGIGINNQNIKVYIDYNNDGQFNETNELVLNRSYVAANTTVTGSVTPPVSAVRNVPLRMRVISDFANFTPTACIAPVYGQTEDYAVTIVTELSTTQFAEENKVSVYPNPVKDIVTVNTGGMIKAIAVFDTNGRQVFNGTYNSKEANVNLSNISAGVYIMKIDNGNATTTQKLIKE